MKIQYTIKGITLDVHEMRDIHEYYEAAHTAEYLMDNYGITDEGEALQLGYDVRETMDDYGFDELEAIDHVLKRRA